MEGTGVVGVGKRRFRCYFLYKQDSYWCNWDVCFLCYVQKEAGQGIRGLFGYFQEANTIVFHFDRQNGWTKENRVTPKLVASTTQ